MALARMAQESEAHRLRPIPLIRPLMPRSVTQTAAEHLKNDYRGAHW